MAGAQPGDALAVEFLEFELPDWGWAMHHPRLRAAAAGRVRPSPYLKLLRPDRGVVTTELWPGVRIPIEPFCGTMGVPGPGMRDVPIPPPHAGGGNIDMRHTHRRHDALPAGAACPVALLSLGDAHAAQGDGEVAISGIECAMRTTIRVSIERGMRRARRRFGAAAAR